MNSETKSVQKTDTPFWDWMMNLGIVKWFCNLGISKAVMKLKIAQALFNYEMITYLLYGVLTTIVNAVVLFGFHRLLFVPIGMSETLSMLISNAIAWIFAMLFAFFTNKIIVFKSKDLSMAIIMRELVSFAAARLISLGMAELIILAFGLMGINDIISFIVSQVVVVIANYVFSKVFIFKDKTKECA